MNDHLKIFGGGDDIYVLCLGYIDIIPFQWISVCLRYQGQTSR